MEMRLTVEVNDRDLQRKIASAIVMLGPEGGRGLMSAIGAAMKRSTLDKFKAQGDGEEAWEPLAESTIRSRRDVAGHRRTARSRKTKRGRAAAMARAEAAAGQIRILDDTGTLRRSIDYQATSTYAEIGTDLNYGVFHQAGTVNMPQRRFMTVTGADEHRIGSLVDKYLQRVFP